ncbi:hypothetical protein C8R44DRAFT_744429 [Mycena epipterygia]|nr:hypothetical protein C8R44DRAFT_744429 [Mycena epipterygia]
MNHFGWLLISLVPFFLHAFAAPLHPRATLTCTDADVSQIAGLTIDARSRLLEINPISGTADPTPIFAAALSLTNAKNVTDQLGTSLLFATAPPPPDNAVALILGSLQDAQKSMASIVP